MRDKKGKDGHLAKTAKRDEMPKSMQYGGSGRVRDGALRPSGRHLKYADDDREDVGHAIIRQFALAMMVGEVHGRTIDLGETV